MSEVADTAAPADAAPTTDAVKPEVNPESPKTYGPNKSEVYAWHRFRKLIET